ncbi:MAG: hypothetical protein PHU14_15680, partial [Methylovulum sp.]|nr:hypothetical protein [Methylovulum sp.]
MQFINYFYTHSVAVLFFLLASIAALQHVFAPLPLVFLLAYLAGLIYWPRLWLLAVPGLLPILDLSLWTGNLLYNEYDLLLLATLAVLYWRKSSNKDNAPPPYQLLYWLLFFAFIASFIKNAWPLLQEGGQPDDIYQSNWNSIHIGKGFFYAWLLWPFLRHELIVATERSLRLLATGIVASMLLFGLLVLWERHVFSALLAFHDRYGLLSAILDFAGTYRITGWFTEMHVGGEAVDGYLVSLTPLVVYLLTRPLKPLAFYATLLAAGMGFYSIIVTFTRTTIASFALSMLAMLIVLLLHKRQASKQATTVLASRFFLFASSVLVLFLAFKSAGYQALVTALFCLATAMLSGYFLFTRKLSLTAFTALFLLMIASWGISDSALES